MNKSSCSARYNFPKYTFLGNRISVGVKLPSLRNSTPYYEFREAGYPPFD